MVIIGISIPVPYHVVKSLSGIWSCGTSRFHWWHRKLPWRQPVAPHYDISSSFHWIVHSDNGHQVFWHALLRFQILQLAVRSSFQELLLLCMLIIMGMLVFSTLIYFAEFHDADSFMHIPIGFWWSIVTMTTVGYGDYHPESGWGYLVGTLCAVSGMLATGLPIPIIASNFNHYYNFARYRDKLVQRKEKGRILATRQKSIAEGLDPDVLPGCPKCSGRPKRNNGNKIQPEAPTWQEHPPNMTSCNKQGPVVRFTSQ